MVAPEHARDRYVTEECASDVSRIRAARAEDAYMERWQRTSSQVGHSSTTFGALRMNVFGSPSPEAYESPITTMKRSTTFASRLATRVEPSLSVTVSLVG